MSARAEIIASVRSALATANRVVPHAPRGYRHAPTTTDLLDLFVHRVEHYQATVERCQEQDVEAVIAAAVGDRSVVVPPDLPWTVRDAASDHNLTAAQLERIDAVVTTASIAIATTGTVVLDHGTGQGRRAVTLLPDMHICVVRADQIVYDVPDAIALLDPERPQTWISGPSATSDIELDRVEGVHGPRTLRIVLLERREHRPRPY